MLRQCCRAQSQKRNLKHQYFSYYAAVKTPVAATDVKLSNDYLKIQPDAIPLLKATVKPVNVTLNADVTWSPVTQCRIADENGKALIRKGTASAAVANSTASIRKFPAK